MSLPSAKLSLFCLLLLGVWCNMCSPHITKADAKTKSVGLEPMNLKPIDGFLISRHATNLTDTILSTRAHDHQTVQPDHTPKYLKLYHFKGYGISFIKPVTKLYSVGLGLKMPITANFPEYDSVVTLPRVGSSFQVFYPFDLKLTLSVSYPLNIVLRAFSVATRYLPVPKALIRYLKKFNKAADNLMRVGCTVSVLYNFSSKLRFAIGPWVFYLPSLKFMM